MRAAFIEELTELADRDPRVFLLTGDLGWNVVEKFAARHPERFLNVGVAEANMAGIATGLALTGYVPFVYSIATFASMRCYEQVRDGALLHQLPIRIVGVGGGYAYGHAGPTHWALEDLTIARTQPGMAVIAPADPPQTRSVLRAIAEHPGPVYLRIGKGSNPAVPGLEGRFALNRPETIRRGRDVVLLACGAITHEAMKAAEALEVSGISAAVSVVAHIPFAPPSALIDLLRSYPAALTLEEGYARGGLGSLVAEAIAENGLPCRLTLRGVERNLQPVSGSETYMRTQMGLDALAVAQAAKALLVSDPV